MGIVNDKIVDAVSVDLNGNVVLTISDHLEWDVNNEHLLLLQDKINAYLSFIETGQLYEQYPNAKGRNVVIQLVLKYLPSEDGRKFIQTSKEILLENNYDFICDLSLVKY